MAMRLFLIYALVELAVVVGLASTIGFGWTVLLLLATFVIGLALAGSQVTRHIRRLQSGLSGAGTPQGAVTDSALVALGTVLVVIPGLASSLLGALLLLPPTRAAARPLVTAVAGRAIGRRVPLFTVVGTPGQRTTRGDYIDGEIIDVSDDVDNVVDVEPPRLPRQPD